MYRLSKINPTTCEGLCMLHYASIKLTVGFKEQRKDILTQASSIAGIIGHSNMKKKEDNKIIRIVTILLKNISYKA